jgi:hypothetical protein
MVPRVVITGLGVVSPNGIGKEAFCLAVLRKSERETHFPLRSTSAGSHRRRNSELMNSYSDARERANFPGVVPLAVAASRKRRGRHLIPQPCP